MPSQIRHFRQMAAIQTLFDTSDAFDAGMAGYDGPRNPDHDAEGFRVVLDASGSIPVLHISGPDGVVEVPGWQAIQQITDACMSAESTARRMAGKDAA